VAEPLTVVRVGDEVAPGLGHALEPADGLGRDAGQDLQHGVVREAGHPRAGGRLGAALHASLRKQSVESGRRASERDGGVRGCEGANAATGRQRELNLPDTGDRRGRRRRRRAVPTIEDRIRLEKNGIWGFLNLEPEPTERTNAECGQLFRY